MQIAADLHYEIGRLHPFFDGNGRTCRLLMNTHLMVCGYPAFLIEPEQRDEYLDALQLGRHAFRAFVLDGVERSVRERLT